MKKILVLITVILSLMGCEKKIEKLSEQKFVFGTLINISVYTTDKKQGEKEIKEAYAEMERIDKKFNTHQKNSIIYIVNNNSGKWIKVDEETLYLLKNIKNTYKLSKGEYDITITPLMKSWGFFEEEKKVKLPSEETLKIAKSKVDFENLEIKGDKIRLKSSKNSIDTGSFLKGYAISKAKEKLEKLGVKNAFISAISSIETVGGKPENKKWKIGLQNPQSPEELYHIISLENMAMGVSGDYQTYVEIDGKKYHHLLDKKTGYPIRDKKMVVVIGKNGFFADMYSTAFFSMPIDDILEFVDKTKDLEVMIVKSDMTEVYSNKFKDFLED